MNEKFQSLMDAAYARWQTNQGQWSKEVFWDQLDAQERFAVFMGNLNYQVENGGFFQWWDNRYATTETVSFILRQCKVMNTEASLKVAELVTKFWEQVGKKGIEDHSYANLDTVYEDMDETLDTQYYEINAQFMADCEAHLNK